MNILIKQILRNNSRENMLDIGIINTCDIERVEIEDCDLRMLDRTPDNVIFKDCLRNDDYCLIKFLD